ncbi:MAG: hypothetical protein ACWGSD_00445 [Thermodesulfobacteriota bacterium]
MNIQECFSPVERSRVTETFSYAERLTGKFFDIAPEAWLSRRYDVKTLMQLENHEIHETAFAHLCKYSARQEREGAALRGAHFYRVCLQDNRILDAIERGSSYIKLVPLMLYIATHELVHILRFERGESDFDMPVEERKKEEGRVDAITRSILRPRADRELNLVLDCFGNDYRIGDISN